MLACLVRYTSSQSLDFDTDKSVVGERFYEFVLFQLPNLYASVLGKWEQL